MPDRRKHGRAKLHCSVNFWDPREGSVTQTHTDNFSCEGFYCLSPEPYSPGTKLEATVEVPCNTWARNGQDHLLLQCQIEVLRVDAMGVQPGFGVACQIDRYAVLLTSEQAQIEMNENAFLNGTSGR